MGQYNETEKSFIMFQRILFLLSIVIGITACSSEEPASPASSKPASSAPAITRLEASFLEESYARARSKQVANVTYKLDFSLSADKPSFSGVAEISFDLLNRDQDLTLDFSEGLIDSVNLNGRELEVNYNNWFLALSREDIEPGPQKLIIRFSHPYSSNGSGLYRFIDPEDGNAYLYSDLEPYDANRIFPSFDQPDIKATYEMTVTAPRDWLVVTSRRENEIVDKGDLREWHFPVSEKFSTYIFSLHAGPYHVWEADADGIPLRFMARQALAEYVNIEDWVTLTQQGFEFFQSYFEVDYPFHKYDQLIVPDFNSGAMENVGAVTFSERYIRRGSYTNEERERIANVVLHEMAHMWFGNLVTMDWWNGLWLNESFATYMAYHAATEATEFDRAWQSFFSRTKNWAYNTDEQVTNHPIELPVDNTDSGFANFDGITYGKGASVLKQLAFLIDPEIFRQGVSTYLKNMSWQNSQLNDFTGALATAANRDLDEWTRQWLYTKGTNRLTVNYECDAGKISAFSITQESMPNDDAELREHRVKLAFYSKLDDGIALVSSPSVIIKGASTEPDNIVGNACPDFVYGNHDDWAFAKIGMQERELNFLAKHINDFEDPFVRSMLWKSLWQAVRDAQVPINNYAEIVLANIGAEPDIKTLGQVTSTIYSTVAYLYLFQLQDASMLDKYNSSFEELAWQGIEQSAGDRNLQKLWFDHYVSIAHSDTALSRLKALLIGESNVAGFVLDQDRRWSVVKRLNSHNFAGSADILEKELEKDPSTTGQKSHISAKAAMPSMETKQAWLSDIQEDGTKLALAELRAAMGFLYPAYQVEYRKSLLQSALDALGKLDASRDQQYLRFYNRYLVKGYCSEDSNGLLQQAIDENAGATLGTMKSLRIALQEDQRCVGMKALLEQ